MTRVQTSTLQSEINIELDVDCDGPSLPILSIIIWGKTGKHSLIRACAMLGKEQTEILISNLQKLVLEM